MTSQQFRAIVAARRRCEVNAYAHVGMPLWIRPAHARRWWRFGR